MKRVLITGANSYVGTSVENWLSQWKEQYKVDTLDMQKNGWREYDFSKYDSVFHVAGIAHADVGNVSKETQDMYYKVNTDLAVETARYAKEQGVKQFILMSSMIVYGGIEHITSTTQPKPVNFYGDSKWQADKAIRELGDDIFRVAVLRPPMIYGKGSKGNYPIIAKIARKSPIFPKVNNVRSMLYIENLCEFVRNVIDYDMKGIFFPQNEKIISTSDLVKIIAEENRHNIAIVNWLTPFVKMSAFIPGKIGNMCKKAFGNSYYDLEMSKSDKFYNIYDFKESIRKTEGE